MNHTVRAALKEWAVVVDAIRRGDQLLVFRKGGIHEPSGRFAGEHGRFWLFPTAFHQQLERVTPRARERFATVDLPMPTETQIPVQVRCDVVQSVELTSFETALHLREHHVLGKETLRDRFEWGGEQRIHLLILRAHQLPHAVPVKPRPEYGGCRSWIELAEPPSEADLVPVLDAATFQSRLESINAVLLSSQPSK